MNDYPHPSDLVKLKNWNFVNNESFVKFADFLESIWNTHYGAVRRTNKSLVLITGGWSGNEEIIGVLERTLFWLMFWEESKRGGWFKFKPFKIKDKKPQEPLANQ